MPKLTTPDGTPWPSITLTLDDGMSLALDAAALAQLARRCTPAVLTVAPMVRNTVERIGEIAPLSPMAKLEIDAVLTAFHDAAAEQAWCAALQTAANVARRRQADTVAEAIERLLPGGASAPESEAERV